MRAEAKRFKFYRPASDPSFTQPQVDDLIEELAMKLRASLFFFHPYGISYSRDNGVATVSGVICCRIDADSVAFQELHDHTAGFKVSGPFFDLPPLVNCRPRFLLEISFQHNIRNVDHPIQLNVAFRNNYTVPVSSFPMAFGVSVPPSLM
jgi:hypothetical protein